MGLWEITGYVAHVLLGAYWLWAIVSTAPQLRRGVRDRGVRVRIVAVKTAACVVLFLAVGVIHFWGTQWWHLAGAIAGAVLAGLVLRRAYRKLVAPPRHRITMRRRALGGRPPRAGNRDPQHAAADRDVTAPREPLGAPGPR
ncbi:MAG: hypothetical protein ACT4RN_18605 [Pseudonocardia sp.]